MSAYVVVMAGGEGTRLWPLSTESHPKQFHDVLDCGSSLFQLSLQRALLFCSKENLLVVVSEKHRFVAIQQMTSLGLGQENILLESEPKNTAATVALACLHLQRIDAEANVLFMPSDQVMDVSEEFQILLNRKLQLQSLKIGLIGIRPEFASTQYGYLKISDNGDSVERFIEKPSQQVASELISMEGVLWNSGLVYGSVSAFLCELSVYAGDVLSATEKAYDGRVSCYGYLKTSDEFSEVFPQSFDYAVLEKLSGLDVLEFDGHWSDVGTWPGLFKERKRQGCASSLRSGVDSEINIIASNELMVFAAREMIAVFDLKGEKFSEQLEVCRKESQVQWLNEYRPWGNFDVLAKEDGFLVKKLTLTPGGQISLQSHCHRTEHWVVVKGQGRVRLADDEFEVSSGRTVVVEKGVVHKLTNTGGGSLIVIEVQIGEELSEGDIVRYEK